MLAIDMAVDIALHHAGCGDRFDDATGFEIDHFRR
jgi:hypothetical protein